MTIKDKSKTSVGAEVNTTQTLINDAKDGYIGKFQIDASPESLQIKGKHASTITETRLRVSISLKLEGA